MHSSLLELIVVTELEAAEAYSSLHLTRVKYSISSLSAVRKEIIIMGINSIYFIHQWLYSPLLGPDIFFSFVIFFYADGRTPWTSDQPVSRPLPTHKATQTQNIRKHTNIHSLNGIRTHDPSVRANEDSSCHRLRGHCGRP
jgi:hypothetical protein